MKKLLFLAIALLCPSIPMAAVDCEWPSVNHDLHNTRSSPCTTVTFEDVRNGLVVQQWNAPGGSVQAAPIVDNGFVYYGDSLGNLYKRDITNGNLITTFGFVAGEAPQGPVTIANGVLYATTVSPTGLRLYAFDLNLAVLPTFNGGVPVDVDPGHSSLDANILSGPVVVDNIVIVGTANSNSNELLVLFPTYRGGFHAFNATTGANLWTTLVSPLSSGYGASGGSFSTGAIDTDLGYMFVGTSNATTPPASPQTSALLAIDYHTGDVKWSRTYTENDVYSMQYACGPDLDVGASPNLFTIESGHGHCNKTKKVVGVGSKRGIYRVFQRKNGKPVWDEYIIPKDAVPAIDGSPGAAYANGVIYAASNADTSGIDSNAFNVLANYGLAHGDQGPFALLLSHFIVTDVTYITAINAKHGHTKWRRATDSATVASLTEANNVVYTGNFRGEFRAYDAETGEDHLIAVLPPQMPGLPTPIGAPITVVGNQFFVGGGIGTPGVGLTVFHKP